MSKSLWHDPVQLIHGLSTRLLKQWHDITENVNTSYLREGNDSIHIAISSLQVGFKRNTDNQ